ncbi:MAG: glycosyltransferase family 4 protein [bacterium]
MRILLTASSYPPIPGGVETYAFEMARNLGRLGEELTVLARSRARRWPGDSEIQGGGVHRAYAKPLLWARYRACVRSERPEALFLTHRADFLGWALGTKRRKGTPIAVTVHGNELYGRRDLARIIEKVNAVDAVFAVSRYAAGRLAELGVRQEILHAVPHGVALDKYSAGSSPDPEPAPSAEGDVERGPVILSLGRLRAVKGFDRMIRALPAVLKKVPDARYIVVGDGPEGDRWKALARELGVDRRVQWLPSVPYDLLGHPPHAYYNACDVFVGPSVPDPATSDVEAFGIAFLEAAACGKPVVVGRCGGAPEAVEDGVTGFVVDAEDPEALAEAVLRLLTDRALRERMGEAGRRRVEREYDWVVPARKVQKVLRELAGEPA